MLLLCPLTEAEVLLLSAAWFADIYLDISIRLGTVSTVLQFSSVDHGFPGSWTHDHLLNICINSKITLRMCFRLVVVTFQ